MQKSAPCLWFDDNAEEAVDFYLSIFKNSKVVSVIRYGDAGPGAKGSVMAIKSGEEFHMMHLELSRQ